MMKIGITTLLSFMMLLTSSYASADSQMTYQYSDSELIQIMRDEGYSSVTKVRDGAIRVKIDGRSYIVFNKDDGDLQCYYGISGVQISYEDINEWNRRKRLSRAYLDSDMDPILESDLLANAGLTPKHVTEFFRIFKDSVTIFRKFILEHDRS